MTRYYTNALVFLHYLISIKSMTWRASARLSACSWVGAAGAHKTARHCPVSHAHRHTLSLQLSVSHTVHHTQANLYKNSVILWCRLEVPVMRKWLLLFQFPPI